MAKETHYRGKREGDQQIVIGCVCVTAGGARAQRGPGGSRRDVDRSPTECVLSWRLASRRGPQPLFGAPLLKVYAGESGSLWPPSQVHTQ